VLTDEDRDIQHFYSQTRSVLDIPLIGTFLKHTIIYFPLYKGLNGAALPSDTLLKLKLIKLPANILKAD
jgi:hypothetical protein